MSKLEFAAAVMLLMGLLSLPAFAQSLAPAASMAQTLPAYADVLVAHIKDLGLPFDLKSNVYLPVGPKGAHTALLLYIHGKGGSYNQPQDRIAQLAISLVGKGIAVATIDYRRSGRMPGMLFDTKAYIRYFRAHATQYNIDPGRIGIWGVSRGGNLAAMLAVTGDIKALEGNVGGNTDQSSRLQASVIESPLTDMFLNADDKAASLFNDYLGTSDADSKSIVVAYRKHDTASPFWKDIERIEAVNPLDYVDKNSPLALITCGGHDASNVILNCSSLFDKYIEKGADADYYAWSPGTHVRVGKDIEDATLVWIADKLSKNLPAQKPPQ